MSTGTVDREMAVPDELMTAALRLPERARADFACALLKSLDTSDGDPEVVRTAWRNELAKRIDDVRSGRVKAVDGHAPLLQTRQRLREQYGV